MSRRLGHQRFEVGGLLAVLLVAVLTLWTVERVTRGSSAVQPTTVETAHSAAELERLVARIRHFVFWVGPKPNFDYELSRFADGTTQIRYVPAGSTAGSGSTATVATYPFLNPYYALNALAAQQGSVRLDVRGGIGVHGATDTTSVYVAFPGVDYQIGVFDPTAGAAAHAALTGQLRPVNAA